ncbi:MAG: pilus assembly protein N-terminal domain-containing protein [Alphaproteobacteria bacterium]
MSKKHILALLACMLLAACSSSKPKILQASPQTEAIHVTSGMATQIEMPEGRIQSVTVGNPNMVSAERSENVVSLIGKEQTGETNLIIRSNDGGDVTVHQYRVIVEQR